MPPRLTLHPACCSLHPLWSGGDLFSCGLEPSPSHASPMDHYFPWILSVFLSPAPLSFPGRFVELILIFSASHEASHSPGPLSLSKLLMSLNLQTFKYILTHKYQSVPLPSSGRCCFGYPLWRRNWWTIFLWHFATFMLILPMGYGQIEPSGLFLSTRPKCLSPNLLLLIF